MWFFLPLLSASLWAVTNHIDKYLISRYFKGGGIGALMVFSSLIALFVLPFIFIFDREIFDIPLMFALLTIGNGFLYQLGILPYLYAMQKDEASVVVPLFQTIPVFGYILGFVFLGETLTVKQLIGSLLIMAGAIGLALDISGTKPKFKKEVLGLMLLSSFVLSLSIPLFKFVALEAGFWKTMFWDYIGWIIFGFFLVAFAKSYRKQFVSVIKFNKIPVLGLNGLNEILNVLATMMAGYAILLAPIALVLVVNGFQPFFVFLYGLILTLFFPKIGRETLLRKNIFQKLATILLIFIGTYILHS